MVSTTVSSVPVTSWWYGQGRAEHVVRRLESLSGLSPSPGPAGVVTARRDELTVTFVEGLKAPLPQPWQPAGREARIGWEAVDPGNPPDPDHPVYLVVFGTTDDGGLVGLNLAAFPRIRIEGDPDTAAALVSRWVLELVATHPAISIGVTDDVWRGPWAARVKAVAPGRVPDVDVLVCGAALTYAERAQIVAASSSPILLDLGQDAAVSTTWVITCGADRLGQISRGASARPMTATLIVDPGRADLIDDQTAGAAASPATPDRLMPEVPDAGGDADGLDAYPFDDTDAQLSAADAGDPVPATSGSAPTGRDLMSAAAGPIDFFAPATTAPSPAPPVPLVEEEAAAGETGVGEATHGSAPENEHSAPAAVLAEPNGPATITPAPYADAAPHTDGPAPVITPLWNRILGQARLCPPHPGRPHHPRENKLQELTVFLQQHHPWASTADIIGGPYAGGAEDRTVIEALSVLRSRLGVVRPGGPPALPHKRSSEGGYHLDNAVRSDWMEFDRLVEILVETTETPHLIAAMGLVTGPPLGGILPKDWTWAKDLREELRDRVPAAAVVLARRYQRAKRFADAVEIARKGLWYDNVRQDLWGVALEAARDGRDKDSYGKLRRQFLDTVPGQDRDPAVVGLTTG